MTAPERIRIGIEACDCSTAFGDARQSCEGLLQGEIALKPMPVLGKEGGDLVPLAYSNGYDETVPPRWSGLLDELVSKIPSQKWGTAKCPVFVTSSNFDVGSLYAYRQTGDERFLTIGTPAKSVEYLKNRYGWGENVVALSHACVTANLGIELASRYLQQGIAEKALVFSYDYISPFVAGGFHSLKILNEQFPAPYQDRETGSIALGDGSGFVVLSKAETPARIESNFLYNEMYHFTANDPEGSGFKALAHWAKEVADGRKIWVKGHGTGTLEAGRLEAESFCEALPESPLVGWKGSLGHTLGSCGVVELAIALEAIRQGEAPGTVGTLAPTLANNVAIDNLQTSDFAGVVLFSNAFGGAHAGCFVSYE
ncbi:hypothetical protein [Pelagicoccus sp. SDUM812002]|uniref:hypothetical protein n=1 Tax=Pelagicoccus sp. SDUM812002 TaxID=3041266 RepID=UPI00280EEC15|nr:hypothetical protein [Pelagicoccus sp. SDUM812002]MDQ8186361.1 hypothetical protein [Pelagicoccus sp. SDUM812002]